MTSNIKRATVGLFCAAVFSVPAMATFVTGEVFVGGGSGRVFVYSQTGTLVQTLSSGFSSETTGMAFDGAGNLYSTNFQAQTVVKYDINGTKLGTFGSGFNADPESILFAQFACCEGYRRV